MSVPDSDQQITLPFDRVREVIGRDHARLCTAPLGSHHPRCLVPLLEHHEMLVTERVAEDHEVRPDWHEINARYPVRCRTCECPVMSAASIPGRAVVWRHVT